MGHRPVLALALVGLLTACATSAPAPKVSFDEGLEIHALPRSAIALQGPAVAALHAAFADYAAAQGSVDAEIRECLSSPGGYDYRLHQDGELYLVAITPNLRRCGSPMVDMDNTIIYAVDGAGVIKRRVPELQLLDGTGM
ncbi:MAG TPA: hypothetical protein VK447_01875 [Myxococcaceae bacterium]|nr:hypothetical protein [Myxococcaceae bacterium]